MNVRELIAELQRLDPDAGVCVLAQDMTQTDYEEEAVEVDSVTVDTSYPLRMRVHLTTIAVLGHNPRLTERVLLQQTKEAAEKLMRCIARGTAR